VPLQPISNAGFGHEKSRLVRVRLDLLAQKAHQRPQIVNIFSRCLSPDLLDQLLVRYHKAEMRCQDVEQPVFRYCERDLLSLNIADRVMRSTTSGPVRTIGFSSALL
jgi:hypothetical protein